MSQVDEKILSSILNSSISSQAPEGLENTVVSSRRRRRRRRRRGVIGEGEEGKKRRLSEEQVKFLEKSFWNERKLESGRKVHLASEAGLDPKQVAVWFQNRRARWKSKQLEEEYAKLKSMHETTVVEKCHLQAEVLKLRQQLLEAEKEIGNLFGRLSSSSCGGVEGGNGELSSSPSTLYSMDTYTLHGELGPTGEDFVFTDEYSTYVNMCDSLNFYGM